MDTKINMYILSIFLKVQNFLITDSNIGAQRFVNMEKFTFEVDDLRKNDIENAPPWWPTVMSWV